MFCIHELQREVTGVVVSKSVGIKPENWSKHNLLTYTTEQIPS